MNTFDISSPEAKVDPAEERRVGRRGKRFTLAERREAQRIYLETLSTNVAHGEAARLAGIHRTLPDYWAEHDAEFSIRLNQARAAADDVLRLELHRRAVQGVERRRTVATSDSAGNIVTIRTETITEYSDQLLMFLARARLPEHRQGQGGTWVVDTETLRLVFDVVARSVQDQETLDRIRAEFANLYSDA